VETRGCYYSTGKHLKWRREFGIYGDIVSAKHVEPEVCGQHYHIEMPEGITPFQAVTGKEIVFGYDTKGRPGFYMIPSRQNTDEATRQIQFAFWMVERCVDLMEPGVEYVHPYQFQMYSPNSSVKETSPFLLISLIEQRTRRSPLLERSSTFSKSITPNDLVWHL